jgi:uncharacterized surface protein with fasciclin (FAS1) repeats
MRARRIPLLVAPALALALLLGACSSGASKSSATTEPPPPTLLEALGHYPDLTSFATAVSLTDLSATLAGPGPYTVFAPTNNALVLADGTLGDPTKPEAKVKLTALLSQHVVNGALRAGDLQNGPLTSITGATFTVAVDGNDIVLTDGQGHQAKIVQKDIVASNGVIHVIDATLLPPKS